MISLFSIIILAIAAVGCGLAFAGESIGFCMLFLAAGMAVAQFITSLLPEAEDHE